MNQTQQRAAKVLSQVLQGGNLNHVLDLEMRNITSQQERGALQDLSYGTLRFYGQLRNALSLLLTKPIKDIQIQSLLLIALYQLQFSKAAPYTIVNCAVHSAKQINNATKGLVNAVLRNYLRKKEEIIKQAVLTEEGKFNYPQWWITLIRQQYGHEYEAILLNGNQHPPMTLRINQSRINTQDYLDQINKEEIIANEVEPNSVRLLRPRSVEKIPGFNSGQVSIQDAGAQYAAILLDIHDGMNVLDACAAPGGKSGHLLELAEINLTAVDINQDRLKLVNENLMRINKKAKLLNGDASNPEQWWDGLMFDRILADVPCSGSGVVRRHPDIKWIRRPSDIESFANQQCKILEALWPLLIENGKLLYATCSIFPRENQQVVDKFLESHKDAEKIQLSVNKFQNGQLLPNDEHDGFFYALLQKIS
jgi:16S rRNA (cytosine967-C5)-methyltransferase